MPLKHTALAALLLMLVSSNPFSRENGHNPPITAFLIIQDVCGSNEFLKDSAQSVIFNYISLLKSTDNFFLGTNNPAQSEVMTISSAMDLDKAMNNYRQAAKKCTTASIGATLDSFYLALKQRSMDTPDNLGSKVNIIHVTTIGVDSNTGTSLPTLEAKFIAHMQFIGITEKNVLFTGADSFTAFQGDFSQTYDPEVALLDLVNTFGSDTKPVIPSLDKIPRCIKKLQAAFAFHTDISSVPRSLEFRTKASWIFQKSQSNCVQAQQILKSVTEYFDIPNVKEIDQDDDTCDFNKDQLEDKTQFTGTMYANSSYIGVETFCNSNMDVYPDLIPTADYKQAPQVMLQKVIDSYSHWYNNDMKMMCHCFENKNEKTTKIILWTPLSASSLDTAPVSFAGFDVVNFKHIVMPFGFTYDDSPLWRSLVPNRDQWTGDASLSTYEVDDIIQDIWTITCRFAGHIDGDQTAEPVNPYTTKKPRIQDDDNFGGDQP